MDVQYPQISLTNLQASYAGDACERTQRSTLSFQTIDVMQRKTMDFQTTEARELCNTDRTMKCAIILQYL